MSKQIEAMKRWVEVFDGNWHDEPVDTEWADRAHQALAEMRQAIAEAEQPAQQQDPVDSVWFEDNNGASRKSPKDCQSFGANGVPASVWVNGVRYTTQPAQRTWVGLTQEERKRAIQFNNAHEALAVVIEAKLKEKNGL